MAERHATKMTRTAKQDVMYNFFLCERRRAFFFSSLFFHPGDDVQWGEVTCDLLLAMFEPVEQALQAEPGMDGSGLAYEKLTHGYWREFIRRETLKAGGT